MHGAIAAQPDSGSAPSVIAVEGRNCWRRACASRVALLCDGAAYFSAFAAAVQRAERSILIVSWDIDSRLDLRLEASVDLPGNLGGFLNAVVSRRPALHAHVLSWDFAMIYALEREALPVFKLGWRTHRRLHFRLDGDHPIGASQHQKIVVVDDKVAFVGGLDLCDCRWDTCEHRAGDPRRVDAAGRPYAPFHDVQIAVEGAAAAALGDLVRERWRRATGERLEPPRVATDPWPPGLVPDLEHVTVAIARSDPALHGRPEVREVERLHLDAIAAAERTIYVENQYLTSVVIGEALAARLGDPHGPEIVVIAPCVCSGWLEEGTMGVLRARLLRRLRDADRFGKLRAYYPVVPDLGAARINVHAKVMVIDDRFLRVGSANLSNRSMGYDSECDVAVEAEGAPRRAARIAAVRDRLLAEHLGVSPADVTAAVAAHGSLVAAIDALAPRALRALVRIDDAQPAWAETLVPAVALADPERPLDAERLIQQFMPAELRESRGRRFLQSGGLLLIVLLVAAIWRWRELEPWIHPRAISAFARLLRDDPLAPLVVVAAYLLGGTLMVPVLLLVIATTLVFGFRAGIAYALLGGVTGAAFGYAFGRLLGRDLVRRVAGPRLNRVSRRLARDGATAVARARLLPLAPFTTVNLIAGASHLPFGKYLVGTALGMLPGIVMLALFADRLRLAIRAPALTSFATLAVVVALLLAIGWWLRRYYARLAPPTPSRPNRRAVRSGIATTSERRVSG